MDHFNAVKTTTTTTGTGNITVGAAAARAQPLSVIPTGTLVALRIEDPAGMDWELSLCTVLSATTFSRGTVLAGSNGTNKVNFGAGTKSVLQTAAAEQLNAFMSTADIPFAAAISLTRPGNSYMAPKTVSGALTFTPAANAVRGALVYLRLIADGANLPIYSAFKEWGGSLGYDNRAGIENQMQFFFDGFNHWVSISQAVSAVAVPLPASAVSLSGPTSGIVNQASTAFTVGVTPVGGAITGTAVVTPTDGAGGSFSPTSVSLSSGTTSATFTYTPTGTGAKSISVTNNGGLANPSPIAYNVAAAATAPAQMAAPTATAGDTTASVTMAAPSNGGSSITGYTVTSVPAGMTDSNAGSTSLTHTMTGGTNGVSYTFTARATNNVGTSVASPASNSVMLVAAAPPVRLINLVKVTESGSGPYSYTNVGGAGSSSAYAGGAPGPGGLASVHFASGVDGSIAFQMGNYTSHGEPILGLTASNALVAFDSLAFGLYGATVDSKYKPITGGSIGTPTTTVAPQNGDILRLRLAGTTLYAEVARSSAPTAFTVVYTWTGVASAIRYINCMISGGFDETPATISNFASSGLA